MLQNFVSPFRFTVITRNIFVYLKHIVKNFSQQFDIVSKHCVCYKKIKNCQCLRYCLNNFDVDLFGYVQGLKISIEGRF